MNDDQNGAEPTATNEPLDLGGIVNYEGEFTLEILNPRTERPTGVSVTLVSAGSDRAKRVLREHQKERLERFQRNKLNVDVAKLEKQAEEQVASCIKSWNWGEHLYKGQRPENNMHWYLRVLGEQPWFYHQCKEASEDVKNFPGPSVTN